MKKYLVEWSILRDWGNQNWKYFAHAVEVQSRTIEGAASLAQPKLREWAAQVFPECPFGGEQLRAISCTITEGAAETTATSYSEVLGSRAGRPSHTESEVAA